MQGMVEEPLDRSSYLHDFVSRETLHPDGTREVETAPGAWVLAHRGYGGNRRLDLWIYPTRAEALRVGAKFAMDCGLWGDKKACKLYERGKLEEVMERYEELNDEWHVLRVVQGWLQTEETS